MEGALQRSECSRVGKYPGLVPRSPWKRHSFQPEEEKLGLRFSTETISCIRKTAITAG